MVEHCARPVSYGVWYARHGKNAAKSRLPLARTSHNSKKFQIASWVPGWKKVFASGKLPLPFFISCAMNNNLPPPTVPIFFAIVVFIGFFGNLLVVLVVTFNKQMRNTTNLGRTTMLPLIEYIVNT